MPRTSAPGCISLRTDSLQERPLAGVKGVVATM